MSFIYKKTLSVLLKCRENSNNLQSFRSIYGVELLRFERQNHLSSKLKLPFPLPGKPSDWKRSMLILRVISNNVNRNIAHHVKIHLQHKKD